MNPKISIVIPALNEADCLDELLVSLEGDPEVEIILVDGGSIDGTCEIAALHSGVHLVVTGVGRGLQMNRGAVLARGEILWFLHADSVVPVGWKQAILDALEKPGVVAGSFRLRFDFDQLLLQFFSSFSRFNHPLFTFGDQGFFMRRSVFEKIGGFREYPFLEDVEIQSRLRKVGHWSKLDQELITSARRFKSCGILLRQLKNAVIVALFLAGVSPFWLRQFYPPQHQLSPASQSASLKPAALKESARRKGRLTRFPFWLRSFKASALVILGSLSFKPKSR